MMTDAPDLWVPTADLVAVAFIRDLPGIDSGQVATTLPKAQASWVDKGFITTTIVGGTPSRDLRQRQAVVSVEGWATNTNSTNPPWNKANNLLELVIEGTEGLIDSTPRDIKTNYRRARILDAHPLTTPRRIENDESGFAHMTLDLQIDYVIEDEVP